MADEFEGNSHKMKAYNEIGKGSSKGTPSDGKDKPQIEKIAERKKTFSEKLKNSLLNEDIDNVKDYVIYDVAIPVMKEAFAKFVTNSINSIFGTDIRIPSSSTKNSRNFDYTGCSRSKDRREETRSTRRTYDENDIVLETREEAEDVLKAMDNVIAEYGRVTIRELFEFCGESAPYTADKYGWRDLSTAYSQKVRDGYLLKLPRATIL